MVYFITFSCYGSHLRGDGRGSFDHVRHGERRFIAPGHALEAYGRRIMKQAPYLLRTPESRAIVRDSIVDSCQFHSWLLYGLHVRTTHAHGVVESDAPPGRIVHDWKAYSTRRLRATGAEPASRLIWAHGASVMRLESREALLSAIRYVLGKQGQPTAVYAPRPSGRGLNRDFRGARKSDCSKPDTR